MNIKPFDATIRSLLESGFYKIPRFQRPYSWESEHVADFWDDAVVSDDPDYFIGSFVVYKDKSQDDLSYIVDGQQRLTTITLLFAAIRDTLLKLGREPLAVGLHKLIERPDINNDLQFVLQSETPYPFLQEYIQKLGDPEVPEEVGAEEQALKGAYKSLLSRLERVVRGIELDPAHPSRREIRSHT